MPDPLSPRDYFAAHADVAWMATASINYAAAKSGVNPPPPTPTDAQLANFWTKVEVRWRWKYADLMLRGQGDP